MLKAVPFTNPLRRISSHLPPAQVLQTWTRRDAASCPHSPPVCSFQNAGMFTVRWSTIKCAIPNIFSLSNPVLLPRKCNFDGLVRLYNGMKLALCVSMLWLQSSNSAFHRLTGGIILAKLCLVVHFFWLLHIGQRLGSQVTPKWASFELRKPRAALGSLGKDGLGPPNRETLQVGKRCPWASMQDRAEPDKCRSPKGRFGSRTKVHWEDFRCHQPLSPSSI